MYRYIHRYIQGFVSWRAPLEIRGIPSNHHYKKKKKNPFLHCFNKPWRKVLPFNTLCQAFFTDINTVKRKSIIISIFIDKSVLIFLFFSTSKTVDKLFVTLLSLPTFCHATFLHGFIISVF